MRCFFTTIYSLGLRLNEALNLQVSDIDAKRMLVHIHRGKGAKDRLIPLPQPYMRKCEPSGNHIEIALGCFPLKDEIISSLPRRLNR